MSMPVSVKIESDLKSRVQELAKIKKRSSHWLMREAISEYVEKEERQEKFKKAALEAWEDYQKTGLHLTSEEVFGWISTWGTENEMDAPECHK